MARLMLPAAALLAASCMAVQSEDLPQGPTILSEVPAAFHGGWDEIEDCAEREPRFSITARYFYNFEVAWRVKEVRLHGPTEVEIVTSWENPDPAHAASPETDEEIWGLRLVDNGRAIVPRHWDEPRFPRCEDGLGRE